MKTKQERREIFRVAIDDLLAANPIGGGSAQRGRLEELLDAEYDAAVDTMTRENDNIGVAISVFDSTAWGEDAAGAREAAAAVLENYLKDDKET